jgi:hypothetical protein
MKSIIFWDMTPCSLLSCNRCFRGTYRLHLQGQRNNSARTSRWQGGAWWIISSTLKMEAICSSDTSVATQQTTRRHIPEDDTPYMKDIPIFRCTLQLSFSLWVRWKEGVTWSIGVRVGVWSMVLCNWMGPYGYEEDLEEKRWNYTLLSLCPLSELKLWGVSDYFNGFFNDSRAGSLRICCSFWFIGFEVAMSSEKDTLCVEFWFMFGQDLRTFVS